MPGRGFLNWDSCSVSDMIDMNGIQLKISVIFIFSLWFSLQISFSQESLNERVRIMFYNTENLFDTNDDTLTNDDEFLPDGERHWDNHRFYRKLNNIAKVIIGVGEWQPPAIVGLCEVENRYVLNQLVYETPLKNFGYRIIHAESPDWRGIDVAMLYRKDQFFPDTFLTIPVQFPFDPGSKTRDILYVKGRFDETDTLHFFINHWPSRYGGYLASQPKRDHAASILKGKVDSLFGIDPKSKIMIMGDFNDGPSDNSILNVLQAGANASENDILLLINLMKPFEDDQTTGTLKYRQSWDVFDQFIVSAIFMVPDTGFQISGGKAFIYNHDFLFEEDERYLGRKPFRTFYGFDYLGGFSDHLPVYIDLLKFSE